jgi:2-oxo-3-hexenedioate decarboxylase/2-keto-4-pentenoate hydratase
MARAMTEAAALNIVEARASLRPIGRWPLPQRPQSEADGYAIQEAVHAILAARDGRGLGGYKIGCTTPTMQRLVGVDHPCYGGVQTAAIVPGPADWHHGGQRSVAVECEIAVRIGAGLGAEHAPFSRASVAGHVAACMASAEIVDDRYVDRFEVGAAVLIADDFFNAGIVHGPERRDWRSLDLAAACGRTLVDGRLRGEGRGADVLGHPLEALAWIAGALAERGRGLDAGMVVSLGSMVAAQRMKRGEQAIVAVDGLGEARVHFR